MPDKKPRPPAVPRHIGKLRRFARPRRGPGDQPPVALEVANLKITRTNADPPRGAGESDPPPASRPSLLTRLIPAWPDPEYRCWLTARVLFPLLLGLAFITLILPISGK